MRSLFRPTVLELEVSVSVSGIIEDVSVRNAGVEVINSHLGPEKCYFNLQGDRVASTLVEYNLRMFDATLRSTLGIELDNYAFL